MDYKFSNIWARLADLYLSTFFHLLIIGIVVLILSQCGIIELNFLLPEFWSNFLQIFIIYHLLETSLEGFTGAGLAKYILGMRLLDMNSSKPIGIARSLLRAVIAVFSFLFFGLGFIAIAFNQESKSLHDLLSSSKVVKIPQKGLSGLISFFWFFVSLTTGLILTIALVIVVFFVSFNLSNNIFNLSKNSYFQNESFDSNSESKIILTLEQKRLSGLTELNNLQYIEYDIDPLSEYNFIQPSILKLLNIKTNDYGLIFLNWEQGINSTEVKTIVTIPKITFKDQDDKDLVVFNQKFIVNPEKTSLGLNFLNLFDYQINNQNIILGLHDEDQLIHLDENLDQESKNFLLYVLREIRSKWKAYQSNLDVKELEEFVKVDDRPVTAIELDFDTQSGYIKSAKIENSNNEIFSKSCKNFVKILPKFRNIPRALKEKKSYKLKVPLTYREQFNY